MNDRHRRVIKLKNKNLTKFKRINKENFMSLAKFGRSMKEMLNELEIKKEN